MLNYLLILTIFFILSFVQFAICVHYFPIKLLWKMVLINQLILSIFFIIAVYLFTVF